MILAVRLVRIAAAVAGTGTGRLPSTVTATPQFLDQVPPLFLAQAPLRLNVLCTDDSPQRSERIMIQQCLSDRAPDTRQAPAGSHPGPQDEDRSHLLELLDERLRFESLLARLSATFIHLPAEQIDGQIERGLQQIVDFLQIERSGLGQFSEDGRELVTTHSYTVPGFPPFPPVDLASVMPWYTARIREGEVLRFTRLPDDLPPEAVAERQYCLQVGMRSQLTIPFRVGDALLGGIGFASFRRQLDWPDDLVQGLQLVAEVFANGQARKRAEEARREGEERLRCLREQLARVGRATTMGELVASIAHEVNQPLCAIMSNAQAIQHMLTAGGYEQAELLEALRDIALDSRRASAVVAGVRAFLRKAPVERVPVNVNDLVREVAALLRGEMSRRGVTLALELADGLPPVLADRVQIQQVVLNLLTNGADAMDGVAPGKRRLVLTSSADGSGTVALVVQDAGVGIDPRDLDQVFNAFFTTKTGSLGMGLAICRSIVEAHGGQISARPNDGRGTTVRFTLSAPGGTS